MTIAGLQKLSMVDYPGKLCATIFIAGCNFRCPFCHNAQLATAVIARGDSSAAIQNLKLQEVLDFLQSRRGLLDGVCLSGGEVLLHPLDEVEDLIRQIRNLSFAVKLDTNGFFYEKLRYLVNGGLLDYVAMDIKSSPARYPVLCGVDVDIAPILQSAEFLRHGVVDYEFRTTVVSPLHTADDFIEIGRWLAGNSRYFLQNFKDSGNILGGVDTPLAPFSPDELEAFRQILLPWLPNTKI
jgi:pyruvate formate lyase activating enzyme